jgi:cobalamin biosynthesis protein CobT
LVMSKSLEEQLVARLAETLGQAAASGLAAELAGADKAAVVALLDELRETSPKVAGLAVEALPELRRRGALESIVPWLDLGAALAGSSGAAAMKYFKESPLILGLLESGPVRAHVLAQALELADSDANVALDFVRKAPELLAVLPADELATWVEVGVELAAFDYVLGIEFFKQSPSVASVIPLGDVRAWVAFGMKLITRNSLGKTDYLGTLEFFRASPVILGDIEEPAVRKLVVDVGSALADHHPQTAVLFLAESPSLLRRLPSEPWRIRVLQYGLLIAEREAEATLAYLRRSPEVLELVGYAEAASEKFEEWFRSGMEVLDYSVEGAKAYFALETKKALESLTHAMSGVPLRQIARALKLFAQALCGADLAIRSLPDPTDESGQGPARATVSPDGRTIWLPAILRKYPVREENVRLYTVMTAHEAGHLEFGTYSLPLARLADLIAVVRRRYNPPPQPSSSMAHGGPKSNGRSGEGTVVETLDEFFHLYPQPAVMRDLWAVLEDARVECRLQLEYPGLRHDLAALAREAVTTRSLLHGMSVREMVVDCLLLLSTVERSTIRIPDSLAAIVEQVWGQCQAVLTPTATAEDAVRVADRAYTMLDDLLAASTGQVEPPDRSVQATDQGAGPRASEETSGQYRPVTNWAYRGVMNPELVRDRRVSDERDEGGTTTQRQGDGASGDSAAPADAMGASDASRSTGEHRESSAPDGLATGSPPPSLVEQVLAVNDEEHERRDMDRTRGGVSLYDEWDGLIQDYRSGWCQVFERIAPDGADDFVETTLAAHGPAVRLLRRYFEGLRPPALRSVRGQADGEDLDLDAAVGRIADKTAGAEPSERIYIRREKRERSVAVVFLVDLSGSTSRQIDSGSGRMRRVIDVEKEGLVLLCEALEAIGDQYAVYGYSGQGRQQVDFIIVKDFDEPAAGRAVRRIGSVTALRQNRDGAAIRHATSKLLAREARHRLLVLISDGKPLDDGYADEYSLEDTKMALREARTKGIEPFCITVDREAGGYLRRMYGEVRFLILDEAGALPERLPRAYHRLTA